MTSGPVPEAAPLSAALQSGVGADVIGILAVQALLDPSEVDVESRIEDLGLDSLGLVEAIFAIEERFDISVPFNPQEPQANEGFNTASVASIIAEVERLIAARAG